MTRLVFVYRCQLCSAVAPPRTPARRVIAQERPRKYPLRREVNRVVRIAENGRRKETWTDDPGGVGREIVRELLVCPRCAAGRNGQ